MHTRAGDVLATLRYIVNFVQRHFRQEPGGRAHVFEGDAEMVSIAVSIPQSQC